MITSLTLFSSLCIACTFSSHLFAQTALQADIGTATLDHDRVVGPRWVRMNFDPLNMGSHTIQLTQDADADVRFSVFDRSTGTVIVRNVVDQWTGDLNDSDSYYLGVWSASGSAYVSAAIAAEPVNNLPELIIVTQPEDVTVKKGDSASFAVSATGADPLGYQWYANESPINGANDPNLLINAASDSDDETLYFVEVTDGVNTQRSDTATLTVVADNTPVTSIKIGEGTLDSSKLVSAKFMRFSFDALATADHTVTVAWNSDADIRFNVFDSSRVRLTGSAVRGSNPGVWTGALTAGEQYSMSIWSFDGEANFTATIEASTVIEPAPEPELLTGYSLEADTLAWVLNGPAPTLDFQVGANTDGWGRTLLRIEGVLLVGGDFQGIRPAGNSTDITNRPWLAALDAVTGQPVSTFNVPEQINDVVRSLALSPDGTRVYVGGDFGLVALNALTGEFDFELQVSDGDNTGRVFDIVASNKELYVGGDFSHINGSARGNLARLSQAGELDTFWSPSVTGGITRGRSAPVQSLALSPSNDILYVGGTYVAINGTPVASTERGSTVSMMAISATDGSVNPERFAPDMVSGEIADSRDLIVHDIAVLDSHIIVAWGGPNFLTLHQTDGVRIQQYSGAGDVQAIQVLGDLVIVGHHGEFFGTLTDPIPPEAVESLDPLIVKPFKLHTFRFDPVSAHLIPEQTWAINGAFGVWAIAASDDAIWIAGNLRRVGSSDLEVEGLARIPALD